MDGRGRAYDNIFVERLWRSVKHEDVYLKGYATLRELTVGLAEYFAFYNGERPHQSLGQKTPEVVYQTAMGCGAMTLDKLGAAVGGVPHGRNKVKSNEHVKSNNNNVKSKTGAAPSICE
jgi:putative transposase